MNIFSNPLILIYISHFASYHNLRPNFRSHLFSSSEPKAQVRYDNEYVDGLLSLSVHIFKVYISKVRPIVIKFHVKPIR